MKWVLYSIAALATGLAMLLWMFVFSQVRSAPAAGAVAVRSVSVAVDAVAVPGRLPVVPVLRAAYGPGDAVYDAQLAAYGEGVVFCVGGVFARRVVREGVESYAAIQTDRGPIPRP